MRLFPGFVAVVVMLMADARLQAEDDPLAYVSPSSGVFAHLRFADLWNGTIAQEIRKGAGKDLDKLLGEFKKEVGIPMEIIDTATFFYPNMPQGPGDERTFAVVATTTKPYDRDTLLKSIRMKEAKPTADSVQLEGKFVLRFLSPTMFLVAHDSLTEKFAKGPERDAKPGVMSEPLKLAKDKHHFVFSIDFSKLPNELFTAAPPELQPFLPLLKSKATNLIIDLKEKKLTAAVNFLAADSEAAEESERSFKLLMKLATDGLADALKEAAKSEELKKETAPFMPMLKELERGLQNVKTVRDGARLQAALALNVDQPLDVIIAKIAKSYREEASSSDAANNLKQIGLAMHGYHDTNGGLPAAAICDKKGKPLLSWRVAILPYVEQQALYKEFKLDEPWDSEHNKKLIEKMPKVYESPGMKADNQTRYRVFHGNNAAFDLLQQTPFASIADGTSNTLMVVETTDGTPWTKPDDIEFDDKLPIEKLLRFVNDKTTVLYCDGSVRTLKKGLGDKTWRLLIQKNDGEVIPDLE